MAPLTRMRPSGSSISIVLLQAGREKRVGFYEGSRSMEREGVARLAQMAGGRSRDRYPGGVRPCSSANLTSEATSLTPSFIIRRLR